jgi:predicted hydrocarbon binding protein
LAAIDAARAAIRTTVHPHFSELSRDNAEGTIRAAGERIVMIRADALSVGLMDYFAGGGRTHWDEGAWAAAGNTLYQLARSLGTRDARACRERDGRLDPMSHCLWGCEQFAATGWARVDFVTPGIFEPNENMHSTFDHTNSFEAEAWLKRREQDATAGFPAGPACFMSAGYAAGWISEAIGMGVDIREVRCVTQGDPTCRFVAAAPDRIEARVRAYIASENA